MAASAYAPCVPHAISSPVRQPLRLLLLLSVACGLVLLLGGSSRLAIEWRWFAQFGFEGMLLRRWLLQLGAFALVCGPLSLLQLQQ